MIGPGAGARVMMATRPVDFRKGADSLAALVGVEYGGDPFSGVIYVFRAKRTDRVKLVWWAERRKAPAMRSIAGKPRRAEQACA
jgi:transposase